MDEDDLVSGRRELQDAAAVRSSRRKIDEAIRALAARPLDEAAAEQMRQTLADFQQSGRAALRRLTPVGQPPVIPSDADSTGAGT